MQVQTAIAQAREAEQRRITAQANGEAEVMKARYTKEVEKVQAETQAKQRLEVAKLDALAAEQTKRKEILLGEGESTRKRLVMQADGALQLKIEALVAINRSYAEAIKEYKGNWVPLYVVGGDASGKVAGGGALQLIELLTAKTAKDLAVDLKNAGMGATAAR